MSEQNEPLSAEAILEAAMNLDETEYDALVSKLLHAAQDEQALCKQHTTVATATEILEEDHIGMATHIPNLISFDNSHHVAYTLAYEHPLEATAILDELLTYRGHGRI